MFARHREAIEKAVPKTAGTIGTVYTKNGGRHRFVQAARSLYTPELWSVLFEDGSIAILNKSALHWDCEGEN